MDKAEGSGQKQVELEPNVHQFNKWFEKEGKTINAHTVSLIIGDKIYAVNNFFLKGIVWMLSWLPGLEVKAGPSALIKYKIRSLNDEAVELSRMKKNLSEKSQCVPPEQSIK